MYRLHSQFSIEYFSQEVVVICQTDHFKISCISVFTLCTTKLKCGCENRNQFFSVLILFFSYSAVACLFLSGGWGRGALVIVLRKNSVER